MDSSTKHVIRREGNSGSGTNNLRPGGPIGPLRCQEQDLVDAQEDKMPQPASRLNGHVFRGRGHIRDPLHMQLLGRNPIVTLARQSTAKIEVSCFVG
jgi:hypothetical protein